MRTVKKLGTLNLIGLPAGRCQLPAFFFSSSLINLLIWPMDLVMGISFGQTSVHHHMVLHPQAPSSLSSCASRFSLSESRESAIYRKARSKAAGPRYLSLARLIGQAAVHEAQRIQRIAGSTVFWFSGSCSLSVSGGS